MKKKKHIDIEDMKAGDDIDWLVAKRLYSEDNRNKLWFVKDTRKNSKPQYFGPRYSTSMIDAMTALDLYCSNYKHLIKAWYLREQLAEDPYACSAEVMLARSEFIWIRSWAPTMPLAIARLMLKVPLK